MSIFLRKLWKNKPSENCQIDWSNSITDGLVSFIDIDGDHVSGHPLYLMGNAKRDGNLIYSPGASSDGAYVPFNPLLENIKTNFTIITFAQYLNSTQYSLGFCIPYRSGSWSTPYAAISFSHYDPSTAKNLCIAYGYNSTNQTNISSTTNFITNTTVQCLAFTKTETNVLFYGDGNYSTGYTLNNGNISSSPDFTNKQPIVIGNASNSYNGYAQNGYFGPQIIFSRTLTVDELQSINDNPYQIFQPIKKYFIFNQSILYTFPLSYDKSETNSIINLTQENGGFSKSEGFICDGFNSRLTATLPTELQNTNSIGIQATIKTGFIKNQNTLDTFLSISDDAGNPKARIVEKTATYQTSYGELFFETQTSSGISSYSLGMPGWNFVGIKHNNDGAYPQGLHVIDKDRYLYSVHFNNTLSRVYEVSRTTNQVLRTFDFPVEYSHIASFTNNPTFGFWCSNYTTGKILQIDLEQSFVTGSAVILKSFYCFSGLSNISFFQYLGKTYLLLGQYSTGTGTQVIIDPLLITDGGSYSSSTHKVKSFTSTASQGSVFTNGYMYNSCSPGGSSAYIGELDILTFMASGTDGASYTTFLKRSLMAPTICVEDLSVDENGYLWCCSEGFSSTAGEYYGECFWKCDLYQPLENTYTLNWNGTGWNIFINNILRYSNLTSIPSISPTKISIGGPVNTTVSVASNGFATGSIKNVAISVNNISNINEISSGSYETRDIREFSIDLPNSGAELGLIGWTNETGSIDILNTSPSPYKGNAYFFGGANALTISRQRIDISSYNITNGNAILTWFQSNYDGQYDPGFLSLRFLDDSFTILSQKNPQEIATKPQLKWTQRKSGAEIPSTTKYIDVVFHNTRTNGTDNDTYIDEISLKISGDNIAPSTATFIKRKNWIQKPTENCQIDWNNPLTEELVSFIDVDGDHVSDQPLILMGNAKRESDLIYSPGGTSDGAYVPFNPLLENIGKNYTIVIFSRLTSLSNYGHLFSIPLTNGTFTGAQVGIDICRSSTYSVLLAGTGRLDGTKSTVDSPSNYYLSENVLSCIAFGKTSSELIWYKDYTYSNAINYFAFTGVQSLNVSPDFTNKQPIVIANHSNSTPGEATGGYFGPVLIYNKKLSVNELQSINENPYQIFQPIKKTFYCNISSIKNVQTSTFNTSFILNPINISYEINIPTNSQHLAFSLIHYNSIFKESIIVNVNTFNLNLDLQHLEEIALLKFLSDSEIKVFREIDSDINVKFKSDTVIFYNDVFMVESEQDFPNFFSDFSHSRIFSYNTEGYCTIVGYANSTNGVFYEYTSDGYAEIYSDIIIFPSKYCKGDGYATIVSQTQCYKNQSDYAEIVSNNLYEINKTFPTQNILTVVGNAIISTYLSEIDTPTGKLVNGIGIINVISSTYMLFTENTRLRTGKGDFFNSAYDYIKNQLCTINYSSTSSLQILKMKISVLDGPIWENGVYEYSYDYPLNHYALILNELDYLDRYIRTKDNSLTENEANFTEYCASKQEAFSSMLEITNPSTGENYKDYEIDYGVRPTSMTEVQYEDLYNSYKIKNSESPTIITSAQTLLSASDVMPLDYDIYAKKTAIENLPTNDEILEDAYNQAMTLKENYDDIYVDNLNNIWSEMWDIIKSLKDKAEEDRETEPEGPDDNGNTITFYNDKLFVANVCLIRAIIDPSDTKTFYGMNIIPSYPYVGGYRYTPWNMDTNDVDSDMLERLIPTNINSYEDSSTWFRNKTVDILPPVSTVESYLASSKNSKQNAYNLTAQLDGWANSYFYICQYYEEELNRVDDETKEVITEKNQKVKWLCSIYDLPEDDTTTSIPQSLTWDRFIELNKRWVDINRIRENQMQYIGLRYQIESLFGTSIDIDIKTDLENNMQDLIDLKENFINILMENNYYTIYIESNLNEQ